MSDQTISKLNILSIQYNNTLNAYQKTYQDYIISLSSYKKNKNLTQVSNTIYSGLATIDNSYIKNIDECKNKCNLNNICSGANYNTQNNLCSTKKGSSDLIKGSNYNISIVPNYIKLSYELKNLNQKLIDINTQISLLINNTSQNYINDIVKRQKQQKILENNNKNLFIERDKINNLINQYQTIDSRLNDSELRLTEYYMRYIILLFIVLIIIILLLRYLIPNLFDNNLNGGSINYKSFINKLL